MRHGTLGLGLVVLLAACRGAGDGAEAVDSLSRPLASDLVPTEPTPSTDAEPARRGGTGPESVLEFGLFGPVTPALGTEASETDCKFDEDPYETCL